MKKATGEQRIEPVAGLQTLDRRLGLPYDQMLVVEGELAQIGRRLLGGHAVPSQPQAEQPVVVTAGDSERLAKKMQEYLREQFSGLLKLPSQKIDPQAALEQYGIDSILAMKLTNQLEKTFASLSKTFFFA